MNVKKIMLSKNFFERIKIKVSEDSKHVSLVNPINCDQNFMIHHPCVLAYNKSKITFSDTTLNKTATKVNEIWKNVLNWQIIYDSHYNPNTELLVVIMQSFLTFLLIITFRDIPLSSGSWEKFALFRDEPPDHYVDQREEE